MRAIGLMLAGVAAMGIAVGCGDDDDDGVGFGGAPPASSGNTAGPTATTPPPIADGAVAPAGATALPAEQVDASALPEGYPRLVWSTAGGDAIGMYGQGGGCKVVTAELRGADDRQVRVTIVETTTSSGPCTMELAYPPLTVPLDDGIGDRSVVLTREQVGPPPGR